MFELRHHAGFCLLVAVTAASLHAQAKTITEKRVKEAVSWLAADERNGRGTGSPELAEAGEWLVDRFAKAIPQMFTVLGIYNCVLGIVEALPFE